MTPHTCAPARTCLCSIVGLEPDEDCPIHGFGDDRRCETCGRFMKRHAPLLSIEDEQRENFIAWLQGEDR